MKFSELLGALQSTVCEIELMFYDGREGGKVICEKEVPVAEAKRYGELQVYMIHRVDTYTARITLYVKNEEEIRRYERS